MKDSDDLAFGFPVAVVSCEMKIPEGTGHIAGKHQVANIHHDIPFLEFHGMSM